MYVFIAQGGLYPLISVCRLLDTAGIACAAQGMYRYLVTHYGNPSALAILDKYVIAKCSIFDLLITCFTPQGALRTL